VQAFSFILTAPGINLDAGTLLSNTDWFVRSQSTSDVNKPNGAGSAKTTGFSGIIPSCELVYAPAFACNLLLLLFLSVLCLHLHLSGCQWFVAALLLLLPVLC
jgi:hypothetical protein